VQEICLKSTAQMTHGDISKIQPCFTIKTTFNIVRTPEKLMVSDKDTKRAKSDIAKILLVCTHSHTCEETVVVCNL